MPDEVTEALAALAEALTQGTDHPDLDELVDDAVGAAARGLQDGRSVDSIERWLQLQRLVADQPREDVTDATIELAASEPQAFADALERLPAEDRDVVQALLSELQEDDDPEALSSALFAADAMRRAAGKTWSASDPVRGSFRAASTFKSPCGFTAVRGELQLVDEGGGEIGVYAVNTGGGGRDHTKRNGPLPPGRYRVSHYRPNRGTRGMVHDGVGYSFNLDPVGGTDVSGRSLFRIHPDGLSEGTNGCLGVREDAAGLKDCEDRILALLASGAFTIDVDYKALQG